jgi:hypothetical protein
MPKVTRRIRKTRSSVRKRVKSRNPGSIPITTPTSAALRLATIIDGQVSKQKFNAREIRKQGSRFMGGMVRDWKGSFYTTVKKIGVVAFLWPDGMYVPGNYPSTGPFLKPPADHRYDRGWTDGKGISTADPNAGTMFAWTGVPTTVKSGLGEAGLGVKYSPKNALSYIRFEPEVVCSATYRAFVEFWPMLIAGTVRARGSIIMAAWQVTTILNKESFELLPWREVVVFDTQNRDAATDLSSDIHDINTIQKTFSWSDLGTTFLMQGGRTYILGVVARVEVRHNVTTSDGKVIPHDGNLFKLYSYMNCNVPNMFVTVQNVLLP